MLFHKIPDYTVMRVFGCSCYPYLRPYNHHKLAFRTDRCTFLGYSSLHKGYHCLHPSSKVYISNHVVFDESSFPFGSTKSVSSHSVSDSSSVQNNFLLSPFVIRHSSIQNVAQLDESSSQSLTPVNDLSASQSHSFSPPVSD